MIFLEEDCEEVTEEDVLEEPSKDEPGSQHQVGREAARDPELPDACHWRERPGIFLLLNLVCRVARFRNMQANNKCV